MEEAQKKVIEVQETAQKPQMQTAETQVGWSLLVQGLKSKLCFSFLSTTFRWLNISKRFQKSDSDADFYREELIKVTEQRDAALKEIEATKSELEEMKLQVGKNLKISHSA